MAEDKYCPLTFTTTKGAYDQEMTDFSYCKEKSCAWWDSLAKSCAILVIAKLGGCGSEGSYHNQPEKEEEKK